MAIGHDMRLSSPELAAAAVRGAAEAGADVVDLGPDRHRDALLRRRRVRLRGRPAGDRLAQPGRLQRDEDRPPRRAAGGLATAGLDQIKERALGAQLARPPAAPARCRSATSTPRSTTACSASSTPSAVRPLRVVLDGVQRHGRADDRARARTAAGADFGATTSSPTGTSPTTSRTRCSRRTAGSSSSSVRERGRRPRHRLGRRRRPLLLHRRHGRVRARRPDHRADRRRRCSSAIPGATIVYDLRASWAVRDVVARGRRHGRSRTGSATPSSRRASARRTPSSPARSRATTTSATSTTATPASCPALVMLELVSRAGQAAVGAPARRSASATSSPARSTRPCPTCR